MKKLVPFILLMLLSAPFVTGQSRNETPQQLGKWKFEAPDAPEGYTSGIIEVGSAEKGFTASISLGGSDYKLIADKVNIENNVLYVTVRIEENEVTLVVTPESNTVMKGNATYSEGTIPLTMTRYNPENE